MPSTTKNCSCFAIKPTPNWTIRANYSHSTRDRTNFFAEGRAFFAQKFPEWQALAGNDPTLRELVETSINEIQTEEIEGRAVDLEQGFGSIPHKATLTTRYKFSEGRFKGAFVASVAGLRGSSMLAAYSASKHAVVGLMRSAALEGAADNIRVNTVNPAQTRTRMMAAIDEAMVAAGRPGNSTARIPLARYAEPADVVDMMLFLASDDSRFCTGATYLVDGGAMA